MSFCDNLAILQEKNNETNYRLAKSIGVHQTSIQNWKNGMIPRREHLARIANHYGIAISDLLNKNEK